MQLHLHVQSEVYFFHKKATLYNSHFALSQGCCFIQVPLYNFTLYMVLQRAYYSWLVLLHDIIQTIAIG